MADPQNQANEGEADTKNSSPPWDEKFRSHLLPKPGSSHRRALRLLDSGRFPDLRINTPSARLPLGFQPRVAASQYLVLDLNIGGVGLGLSVYSGVGRWGVSPHSLLPEPFGHPSLSVAGIIPTQRFQYLVGSRAGSPNILVAASTL